MITQGPGLGLEQNLNIIMVKEGEGYHYLFQALYISKQDHSYYKLSEIFVNWI